jgi:hypothetical protein
LRKGEDERILMKIKITKIRVIESKKNQRQKTSREILKLNFVLEITKLNAGNPRDEPGTLTEDYVGNN